MNTRKLRTTALLAALTLGALAQPAHAQNTTATPPAATMAADVQPEAAALIQKAVQAMGGEAFTAMRSYRQTSMAVAHAPDGKPVAELEMQSVMDYTTQRLMFLLRMGGQVVGGEALTPEGAFEYRPGVGTTKKPKNLEAKSRESMYEGENALKRPISEYQLARVLGPITRHEVTGTGVQIKVGGVESLLLIGDDGALLGYGDVEENKMFILNDEFKQAGDVGYASAGRAYAEGTLLFTIRTTDMAVNVDLTDADFKLP